nr:VOC family protein [Aeromicrobium sp. Leaf291]
MRLENIVWDSPDPRALGHFWAEALGADVLTEDDDGLEARLHLAPQVFLDLCFPPASTPADVPQRLHLDLRGAEQQHAVAERLVGLGARRVDIGQGDVPWVVLADPDGNAFCVMEDRPAYRAGSGPVAALPLDCADPDREARFWAAVTGWAPTADPPRPGPPVGRGAAAGAVPGARTPPREVEAAPRRAARSRRRHPPRPRPRPRRHRPPPARTRTAVDGVRRRVGQRGVPARRRPTRLIGRPQPV